MRDLVAGGDAGPNTHRVEGRDRPFEADAPPERVICPAGGNEDVRQVDAGSAPRHATFRQRQG